MCNKQHNIIHKDFFGQCTSADYSNLYGKYDAL